jgi:hypothetical protein
VRYVIIRDDDTNAFTPVDCLERLYRPLLNRGLPINLAVIPEVDINATMPGGGREGFLCAGPGPRGGTRPLGSNPELVRYLLENPGYHVLQHGCHHDCFEFDRNAGSDISRRIAQGSHRLMEAGFPRPETFVAPHDKLSKAAYLEVARHFRVLSTGWFELRRLPCGWWPQYTLKKVRRAAHWRIGRTLLLSHPGCLLSCHRESATILDRIVTQLNSCRLTVLVTHWWEYFREGRADERFINLLHETSQYLAANRDIKVISFGDLVRDPIPLN